MEGKPNFESYGYEELLQAKNGINKQKYPEWYKEIIKLLASPEIEAQRMEFEEYYHAVLKYKTFWRRFFAVVIDGLFIWLVLFVECSILGISMFDSPKYIQAVNALQFSFYLIFMHGYFGQTLGKMVTGVKVVNNANESNISFYQSAMRESVGLFLNVFWVILAYIAMQAVYTNGEVSNGFVYSAMLFSILTMLWGLAEFVTMLFNSKRRAVHDFIGKTVVICI